jgi:hypothetical protein
MMRDLRAHYNRGVGRLSLFLLVLVIVSGARASADPQDIATTNAPIVLAQLSSGTVTVRTWDRPDVQIEADPSLVQVIHIPQQALAGKQLPPGMTTFWAQNIQTPSGEQLSLPPEPFPVAPLDAQPHDGVRLIGGGDVTITVPATTAFLLINDRQGDVSVDGFHGGTLVSHIGRGALHLNNVSGTVGAQVNNGPITATNSTFDRIRVRNGRGGMFFNNVDSRQIEATTLMSPIVYDNGSFQPGLARFESQKGNIALGVAARGGAQIDAHSASGQVLNEGAIRGGPVVTATSGSGSVMTYTGALRDHPNFQQQFQMLRPGFQQSPRVNAPQQPRRPATPSPQQQSLQQRTLKQQRCKWVGKRWVCHSL